MQKNVGGYDRIARLLLGSALVYAGYRSRGGERGLLRRYLGVAAMQAGSELLLTAVVRRCPVNEVLGVNTCDQTTSEALRTVRARLAPGVDHERGQVASPAPT